MRVADFSTEKMSPDTPAFWRRHWLWMVYLALAIIVVLQRFEPDRHGIFLIYRAASFDLFARRDLYGTHLELMDHFRYSPTFALLFAPIAFLEWHLGISAWTLLNLFGLYWVLGRLLPWRSAQVARVIVLGDLVRSAQWGQSNGVVAALIVAAAVACEQERPWAAGWAVAAGGFTKIFPFGAGLFALLRPFRVRAVITIAASALVLLLLPALVTGPGALLQEYRWWFALEGAEAGKIMWSVMDLLDVWTGHDWPKQAIQVLGLLLLLVPVFVRRDCWDSAAWRLRVLASFLMFCVLFNYGAESPSYVIAMTGVAVWWVATPRTRTSDILLLLTILFSTISHSSLVPPEIRIRYLDPPRTIVMPVLASFLVIQWQLLRGHTSSRLETAAPIPEAS